MFSSPEGSLLVGWAVRAMCAARRWREGNAVQETVSLYLTILENRASGPYIRVSMQDLPHAVQHPPRAAGRWLGCGGVRDAAVDGGPGRRWRRTDRQTDRQTDCRIGELGAGGEGQTVGRADSKIVSSANEYGKKADGRRGKIGLTW
jgi:hypothetical protein